MTPTVKMEPMRQADHPGPGGTQREGSGRGLAQPVTAGLALVVLIWCGGYTPGADLILPIALGLAVHIGGRAMRRFLGHPPLIRAVLPTAAFAALLVEILWVPSPGEAPAPLWLTALLLGFGQLGEPLLRVVRGRPDRGDLTCIAAWAGLLIVLWTLTQDTLVSYIYPLGALRTILIALLAVVVVAPLTDWPGLRRNLAPFVTLAALGYLLVTLLSPPTRVPTAVITPWWSMTTMAGVLAAGLAGELLLGLLRDPNIELLTRRVDELSQSRRGVLDVQASELRQIERDLHDGAQVRLVALSMKLGRAEDRYRDDPETAALLREAREDATAAIRELRELARGIAPPVLANRGLEAAVRSIAQRSGSEVSVRVRLGERPAPVLERAAYFVVAESLTNAVKHAPGARVEIVLEDVGDQLVVEVTDFGAGGADLSGSGLSGLRQRVEALDGVLSITSPDGVGTQVEARLPCGR